MTTVQDLIEQSRKKEDAIKTAKKGIRKERKVAIEYAKKGIERERREEQKAKQDRRDKIKSYFTKPYSTPVSKETREADVAISRTARKVISKIAPKGSIVKALTSTAKKTGKKGRGRPKETYKVRYVPGVGAVKVPTHIYKKMMAKAKADARLARVQQELAFKSQMEQRQMQAEQIAMQQDPRFQAGADDSFFSRA